MFSQQPPEKMWRRTLPACEPSHSSLHAGGTRVVGLVVEGDGGNGCGVEGEEGLTGMAVGLFDGDLEGARVGPVVATGALVGEID